MKRWGWRGVRPGVRALTRRVVASVVLGSLAIGVVVRVALVSSSLPPGPGEQRLAASVVAALHGGADPGGGVGDFLAGQQVLLYARLTGALDRHANVLAGTRELAVGATAVLVALLLALVMARRVPASAAGVALAGVLIMGPAIELLAVPSPGLLAGVWAAAGFTALLLGGSRPTVVGGWLSIVIALATEPLLAVPLAAALLVRATGAAPGGIARKGRHRAAVAQGLVPQQWGNRAVVVCAAAAVGLVVTLGPGWSSQGGPERTVLLLAVGLVAAAGLGMRRARPLAVATAVAALQAAVPWNAGGRALPLAMLAALALAVLVVTVVVQQPVAQRPHPLLRILVALPTAAVVLVGGLLVPVSAAPLPHAALAQWLAGPDAPAGTVAVPESLWGDLVRDGISPDRLARAGSPSAGDAALTVEVGSPPASGQPVVVFGAGGTSVTVQPVATADRATAEQRGLAALRRHTGVQEAAPATYGSLLAGHPGLSAPPDVLASLREGDVDVRVMATVAGLLSEHRIELASPGTADRRQLALLVSRVDGQSASGVGGATPWLAGQDPALAPAQVTVGPMTGVLLVWDGPALGAGSGS
jgi:putative peptide zinc metalloprotease protein